MKNFLVAGLLLLISAAYAEQDFPSVPTSLEVDVFGKSYHTNRAAQWHETNPGLGLTLTHYGNEHIDALLSAGTYKDSFNENAYYALFGGRLIGGSRDGLHVCANLMFGYRKGSGFNGTGIVPMVSVGYDWIDVCAIYQPSFDEHNGNKQADGSIDPHTTGTSIFAAFIKFRVWTF